MRTARKIDIAMKKQPKQSRAVATVDALVEAAVHILRSQGPGAFTANRVAERAGANVASFYQYFPNKEALLFHIARREWDRQLARLAPILAREGPDPATKLKSFLREFFLIEADEADLRQALRAASVELRDTDAFRELMAQGTELTHAFLASAVGEGAGSDPEFAVRFIVLLTTSFAERTTDARTPRDELLRQADLLADMVVAQFRIA